jgi:DNA-binding transcriptional regulator YiaG
MVKFDNRQIGILRESLSMTVAQFAGELGVGTGLVRLWEFGVYTPSMKHLVGICNKFGLRPEFFFRDE